MGALSTVNRGVRKGSWEGALQGRPEGRREPQTPGHRDQAGGAGRAKPRWSLRPGGQRPEGRGNWEEVGVRGVVAEG